MNTSNKIFDELEEISFHKPQKCIKVKGFILVKTDLIETTGVTLKSPDNDPLIGISDEYKPEIEALRKKYNLKSREIAKLRKEIEKAILEQKEYERQIEMLREKAHDLALKRDNKKALQDFYNYSNKYMISLKGIRNLNSTEKVGVEEKLEEASNAISDTYPFLD